MSQIQGLPPLPQCFDGLIQVERTVSETSLGEIREGITHRLNIDESDSSTENLLCKQSSGVNDTKADDKLEESVPPIVTETPFTKLNSALRRLKDEMVCHI